MKEFKYVITDAEGIHARPATMLVKKAAGFKSNINIEAEGKKVNAKGVLGVMGLGAKKGAEITVTVDGEDEEIAAAILFLLERQKLVVEGGGAASVAAIMHHKFAFEKEMKIGAVLSGGNIDVQVLSIIIEKGLIKSHRKMKLVITLIDKPGALMRLTDLFKNANANIIQIDYDRFSTKLSYGDAQITIMLETKGVEHQKTIRSLLEEAGYPFKEEV